MGSFATSNATVNCVGYFLIFFSTICLVGVVLTIALCIQFGLPQKEQPPVEYGYYYYDGPATQARVRRSSFDFNDNFDFNKPSSSSLLQKLMLQF